MTLSKETRDDLQSLITRFSEVGKLPQGGVTRLAYTPLEDEMHRIFREEGKAHGFNVWEDSIGNSFVGNISDEKEPHTLLGSHLDSVIEGGPYDGVVGVAGGFAAMLELKRQGKKIPLVVAAFRCEESSNFQHCTVGSGLMTHALDLQGLQNVVSLEGEKLSDCLARHGYRGEVPVPEGITRYIELHIEQGRVLQENDTQIGIVTAIAAPHRYRLRLQGFSEHSGATPMNLRLDALCAASEVILAVEQIGREESVNASVATVGCIDNHPNTGKHRFSSAKRRRNSADNSCGYTALRRDNVEKKAAWPVTDNIKHYSDESVRDVKRCESQRESRCVFNQVHLAAGVACDLRADPAHNGDVCGHCNDRSVGLSRNGSCCSEFLYNMVGPRLFNGTWRWIFCAGGS